VLIAASSSFLLIAVAALPFDYARVESKYRFYFGSATSASGPSLEELVSLTNHTLYRKEAEQIYIAVAPIDSLQATLNAEMGRRVYEAMPHSTFAIVRAGHLVYLEQPEAAATILKRTCKWWPPSCDEIRTRFNGLAEEKGEPFSSFAKAHLDKALVDSTKLEP
jgi:pimeloyl-ACP methyl ester carboxylesterase